MIRRFLSGISPFRAAPQSGLPLLSWRIPTLYNLFRHLSSLFRQNNFKFCLNFVKIPKSILFFSAASQTQALFSTLKTAPEPIGFWRRAGKFLVLLPVLFCGLPVCIVLDFERCKRLFLSMEVCMHNYTQKALDGRCSGVCRLPAPLPTFWDCARNFVTNLKTLSGWVRGGRFSKKRFISSGRTNF